MKATQQAIDGWMDKQNMVCTCNTILFNFKKEGNDDVRCDTNTPWGHYPKWNKPVTEGKIVSNSTYMRYQE